LPAIGFFCSEVEREKPDLVIHGGDLFDTRGQLDPTSIYHTRGAFNRIRKSSSALIVPGNHDASNAAGEIDSARAVLGGMVDAMYTNVDPSRLAPVIGDLRVAWRPEILKITSPAGGVINVACLPCPSKYHLMADGTDPRIMTDLVIDILRGLAASAEKVKHSGPTILVMHGAIAGVSMENERTLGVGQDVTVPLEALAGPWDIVLAGHIHKAQKVGPAYYAGSLQPLTFAQAGYKPSYLDITIGDRIFTAPKLNGDGRIAEAIRVEVPVEVPFISLEIDRDAGNKEFDLLTAIRDQLLLADILADPQIRIKIKAPADELAAWPRIEEEIRSSWPEVKRWKFILERVSDMRGRSNVKVDEPLDDLLAQWANLNEIPIGVSGDAIRLGRELEDEIADKAKPALASYRPTKTTVRNYKQIKEGRIAWDELPRITCIKGPNAAGKSNAAKAEAAALFGPRVLGAPLRRFVKNGETEASIIHEFSVDQVAHKIERTVKLSSSGKASGDVSFSVFDSIGAEKWQSLNGANARVTQTKIEALVGSPEMFFSTRFARQHEINRLLQLTPAELKDVLQEALQAGRFKLLEEAARARLKTTKKELLLKDAEIDRLANEAEDLVALELNLRIATDRRLELQKELQRLKVEVDKLEEAAAAAREAYKAREAKDAERATIAAKIDSRRRERAQKERDAQRLETLVADATTVAERLDLLGDLNEDDLKLREIATRDVELDGSIRTLESKLEGILRGFSRQVETTSQDIKGLEKRAALLAGVPCQTFLEKLDPSERSPVEPADFKGCQFLEEAVLAREHVPALKAGLKVLEDTGPDSADVEAKLEAQRAERAALAYDIDKHRALYTKIAELDGPELNRKAQEIAGAKASLKHRQEDAERLTREIEKLEAQAKSLISQDESDTLDARRVELQALEFTKKTTQEAIQTAIKALQSTGEDKARLEVKAEAAREANRKGREAQVEQAKLERDFVAGETFVRAVGRDGVPALILERAIPQLQGAINELLDGSPLSVEIEPIRDLSSGKCKDEIVISFRDQNGEQVLEDASGYQANLLGVALRAAIAELEGDRAGIRPEFFVIDEGFGAYDLENIPHGREMIHRLADRFGKVVYITHVPEVQAAAEGEIIVTPTAAGSIIEEVTN
jgi:exonuclease SbcC